jgi:hypothetical protein
VGGIAGETGTGGGGIAGGAGAAAGAGTGGASSLGAAGSIGVGASGGAGGDTAQLTTDPWPSSCAEWVDLVAPRPYSPAAISSWQPVVFGSPALPGETMTATLNGVPLSFSNSFDELANDPSYTSIFGYGDHGEFGVYGFPLAVGSYACPQVAIGAGGVQPMCCRIDITKVGEVGDTIEGTFSGIIDSPLWINVENGQFKVVRRPPPGDGGMSTGDAATADAGGAD